MRFLATALDAYRADSGTFPIALTQLTTPVAYLAQMPRDGFSSVSDRAHKRPYLYARFEAETTSGSVRVVRSAWVLSSVGPDGVPQLHAARDMPPDLPLTRADVERRLLPITYEPTNGTKSRGDVFRLGGL